MDATGRAIAVSDQRPKAAFNPVEVVILHVADAI